MDYAAAGVKIMAVDGSTSGWQLKRSSTADLRSSGPSASAHAERRVVGQGRALQRQLCVVVEVDHGLVLGPEALAGEPPLHLPGDLGHELFDFFGPWRRHAAEHQLPRLWVPHVGPIEQKAVIVRVQRQRRAGPLDEVDGPRARVHFGPQQAANAVPVPALDDAQEHTEHAAAEVGAVSQQQAA